MTHYRDLLLPELENELSTTRRMLAALPEGHGDFKAAEKSMTLSRLAGHVAEMPSFAALTLTGPDLDLGKPGGPPPYRHETTVQTLAAFTQKSSSLGRSFTAITRSTPARATGPIAHSA